MSHRRPGGSRALGLLASVCGLAALATSQIALAQGPAPAPAGGAGRDAPLVGNLTAKYRLQERYTTKDVKGDPGQIGQYQVGFRETISPRDEPGREPLVRRAIYTERPAAVSPVDDRLVTDLVRHYTSVTITPDPWKGRKDRRPIDDLTIWYRREMIDTPSLALVLTPGRTLLEEEYTFAVNYDFVTNFAYLLPERPVQIADTWPVPRTGAVALTNDDKVTAGELTGKLAEIRAHPTAPGLHLAIINVTGRVATARNQVAGDIAVNARLQFAFAPKSQDDREIEAFGAIEKLSLTQLSSTRIPDQKPVRYKRELILERKRPGSEPTLTIPNPMPKETPENSWLTSADPKGQYSFRHPQEFQRDLGHSAPGRLVLSRFHANSDDDTVLLEFIEKPQGRPEALFKQLVDSWRKSGFEVLGGRPETLAAADWPNMSVHHMEAVLKPPSAGGGPPPRPYVDAYVIQFPRDIALNISATTFQDDPSEFRKQVRGILKTIRLGPPRP